MNQNKRHRENGKAKVFKSLRNQKEVFGRTNVTKKDSLKAGRRWRGKGGGYTSGGEKEKALRVGREGRGQRSQTGKGLQGLPIAWGPSSGESVATNQSIASRWGKDRRRKKMIPGALLLEVAR